MSANDDPPQLAQMLQELNNRKRGWDVILAIESSRLARDVDLAGVINYQIRKAGCRVEYSKHPTTENPAMDMMRDSMMRGFDAYWSLISKQKGLAGMKFNVENGHRAGGRAPFGYRLEHTPTGAVRQGRAVVKSRLLLDPENAPKVKRYLKLRAEGRNRPDARAGSGMPSSSVTTLVGIERNALTYAGITVWNRHTDRKVGGERYKPRSEWVLQRGTHDALITEAEAEKLMAHALPRPERRPRTASVSYLLTGLLFTPDGKAFHANGDGYYRANKGRRIPADALEEIVREQMNEEVDSHEFTARFIAELRREADRLDVDPEKIKREKKAVQTKLANLVRLAERAPNSELLAERLVALEAEMVELDAKLANAEQSAAMRRAIRATSAEEAAQMIAGWMAEDGASLDEQRAALAQLVERIEFNPATGGGRVLYRIAAWGDGRFRLSNKETGERGASPRGCNANSGLNYCFVWPVA